MKQNVIWVIRTTARRTCSKYCAGFGQHLARRLLDGDVRAAYEGDPAVWMRYYFAIRAYLRLFIIASTLCPSAFIVSHYFRVSATGIDIHPGAKIGKGFFMVRVWWLVKLVWLESVSVGSNSWSKTIWNQWWWCFDYTRHPIVEDDVVVYAGAKAVLRLAEGPLLGGMFGLCCSR